MSVGYFYPDIVGNGNASISDATQKLNNVANKINICNSALDSRIKSRLSYNLGNIANQVSKLSDKTQNYHTKVNDVVQEYYKIMAETSGMVTNASFLFGDILGALKGSLSGDVLALGDNFISALSTFLTVNNGQAIAQNILASGMQFVGNIANGIQGGLQNFTDNVGAMWQETQATVINGARTVTNWWNNFTNSVVTEFNNFQDSVSNAFNDAKVTVIDTANNVGGIVSKLVDDFTNSEIGQTIINIGNNILDVGATVISSAGTSLLGVVNGLGNIVEDVVDLGALVLGVGATVPAAFLDLGSYLATGEGLGAIDSVWEGVQSFVQEKHVDNAFDYFFNETSIGNFLNEHTIDAVKYETGGYDLIKGASYIVGTIALAVATAGGSAAISGASTAGKAGSLALNLSKAQNIGKAGSAISFATGTSRGAEEAWNNGATTLEGISYGLLNGAWEGGQWLLGSKFAGLGFKTVGVDILSGAADIPLRTALQGLYSDKNYVERFEDNGGVSGVLLNTTLAGLLSGIGELPVSKQFFGTDVKTAFATESNFDNLTLSQKIDNLLQHSNTTIIDNNAWTSALFPSKLFISDSNLSDKVTTIKWFNENAGNLENIKVNETGATVLDNSVPLTSNIFDIQMAKEGQTIGVDQGGLRVLKHSSPEFKHLRQKLKNAGFSSADATKILNNLDNPGACSYADVCNEIVNTFKNDAERFEEIFGYPMYVNGKLNGNELLLDLYMTANDVSNGGNLFERVGNKYKIIDNRKKDNHLIKQGPLFESQIYLNNLLTGKAKTVINNFLKSHNSNLSYEVEYLGHKWESYDGNYSALTGEKMGNNFDTQTGKILEYDINQLKSKIEQAISDNKNVSISVSNGKAIGNPVLINMITGEKYCMDTSAHAMFVIGTNPEGLLVDSWGKPYLISWNNLKYINFLCSASTITGI